MKKIRLFLLLITTSLIFLTSCEENEVPTANFVTFGSQQMDVTFEQGTAATQEVKIYTANITDQDRTFGVVVVGALTEVDAAAYIVPTTITIPGGSNEATLTISLTDINMSPFATQALVISLETSADMYTGNDLTMNVSLKCPNNGKKFKLELGFDDWPEEVYWRLVDVNAAVIVAASQETPGYGAYAGMSRGEVTIQECIPSGDYQLQIFDSYGDGGTSYIVTAGGVQVGSVAANAYGSSATVDFSI